MSPSGCAFPFGRHFIRDLMASSAWHPGLCWTCSSRAGYQKNTATVCAPSPVPRGRPIWNASNCRGTALWQALAGAERSV
uniref:Uncharacterized protein n=1 Tax=Arundo donax TaxID=35708 RepID=A0A0A8YHU5_ARUDO